MDALNSSQESGSGLRSHTSLITVKTKDLSRLTQPDCSGNSADETVRGGMRAEYENGQGHGHSERGAGLSSEGAKRGGRRFASPGQSLAATG
jgi:hypothetical protein